MKAVQLRVALQSALAIFLAFTADRTQAEGQRVRATSGGIEAKFE